MPNRILPTMLPPTLGLAALLSAGLADAAPHEVPTSTTSSSPATSGTSTSAPQSTPAGRATSGGAAAGADEAALHHSARAKKDEIPHKGFTIDFRGGALGCTGSICRGAQNTSAGGQVAGFLGGNIRGFVDLGLAGAWGKLRPDVSGTSVLDLYGIDRAAVEKELAAMGAPADLSGLDVQDADVTAANVGVALRVHFVPRGRVIAYIGTGVGYQSYKSTYQTSVGEATLRFHGIAVPIQAGVGVHLIKNLALVGQFDYTWAHYVAADLQSPVQDMVAPMSVLESVSEQDLQSDLPKFWGVTFGLRARF